MAILRNRLRLAALAWLLAAPLRSQGIYETVDGAGTDTPLVAAHFDDFSQGLYDTVHPSKIPPNASPDATNVLIDEPEGSLRPRNGFTHCGALPSGNPARSLYEYERSDGSRKLIASDNANVYETADCVTWTTIVTGLSSSDRTYFKTVREKLWFVNRSTWVQTWDGTTRVPLDGRANTPVPTVPQCNYLEYWLSRVWCARTESHPAGIAFSALTETTAGNDLDPSTGTLSWPATNLIQINRQSGGPLYGIKVYGNRLYAFKEREIWNIDFQDEFNFRIIKTQSHVGTRYQNSIKEKEGYLYFVGPDGFYRFDGNRSTRISDNILFFFSAINQATANLQRKSWDADSDFDDGTFNGLAGISVANAVSLSSMVFQDNFNDLDITNWTGSSNYTAATGQLVNGSGSGELRIANTISTGSFSFDAGVNPTDGYNSKTKFISNGTDFSTSPGYYLQLEKNGNGVNVGIYENPGDVLVASKTAHVPANGGDAVNSYRIKRDTSGNFQVFEDGGLILTGTDNTYNTSTHLMLQVNSANATWDNFDFYRYVDSGTWVSEDYNMVTISTFSTYNSEAVANSGTIGYEVRVATNSGGLAAASYSAITPGSLVSGTTNQVRFQTRVTITGNSTDKTLTPYVSIITLNWYRSGSPTQTVDMEVWKNRLWVSASTGASNTPNIVFVNNKYKDEVWIPYTMPVGAMVNFADNFYAAASTHSGIYRMDYGSSDNGVAIVWYWTTRDENFGNPYTYKILREQQVDFKKETASNALLGYSINNGSSFTDRTVDMSGSGYATSRKYVYDRNQSFRFRIGSATLDERAIINRISGYASLSRFRD